MISDHYHPWVDAQAAATCTCLMRGRFFLGVGTGENLNEHVLGDRWPAPDERLEMLEEAVAVMRLLWRGGYRTHRCPTPGTSSRSRRLRASTTWRGRR